MKQRLREQKEKNHEEFRKQMVRDVMEQLDKWKTRTNLIMSKNHKVIENAVEEMRTYERSVGEVGSKLSSIEYKTLTEIKRFKRGRSWKFYGACYLASLLGSLTAIVLCGMYWPTIQWLLS